MKKIITNTSDQSWLAPNYRVKDIKAIDFKALSKEGILYAAVDIDGTLVEVGSLKEAVTDYVDHLVKAKKSGYIKKIIIATNRLPFISKSAKQWFKVDGLISGSILVRKPSKKYYQKLLDSLGAKPEQVVMIGDRLWQDIYGANRLGIWTILVDDLGREPWYDRIILHRWRQNRLLKKILRNPFHKNEG